MNATPTEKIAIVETVETTGNTFLSLAAEVSREIGTHNGKYVYYGPHHSACESGHTMGTDDVECYLESIHLDDATLARCIELVDELFALYTAFTEDAYRYVTTHVLCDLQQMHGYGDRLRAGKDPALAAARA